MTKRNLSIVAFVVQVVSAFLLYIDGTFIWYCWTLYENISQDQHSFDWLIDTQFDKGFLVLLMLLLILLNIGVSIISFFKDVEFLNKKSILVLPAITVLVYVILCMYGNSYSTTFKYYGEMRRASAGLGMMFYVELVLLVVNLLIECAKQYMKLPYAERENIQ